MKDVTIVIQDPPYTENNKAWHALRFAGAALAEDMKVRVFLLERGVEVGRKGHVVPEGKASLEQLLAELIAFGLEVNACGMCLTRCCLEEGDMIAGISRGSMRSLAAWVKSSDHVMTF
jgi:sulfur relay (sulfurtransferase) complex TusBCD TusD component (DsrE family)